LKAKKKNNANSRTNLPFPHKPAIPAQTCHSRQTLSLLKSGNLLTKHVAIQTKAYSQFSENKECRKPFCKVFSIPLIE